MSTTYGRTPPWNYPDAPRDRFVDCACGGSAQTQNGRWPGRCVDCDDPICEDCYDHDDVCRKCMAKDRERRENALTQFAALSQMSRMVAQGGAS